MKFADMTGERFGRLVVVACNQRARMPGQSTTWLCRCDCGAEKVVARGNLRNGSTNSCGCIRNTQNGLSRKHPLWKRWANIIERTTSPSSKDFGNYGGRGIRVCRRWRHFPNFLADMGPTFFAGATIERIENDGNYEPTNCRWATASEQGQNTRRNNFIETPWGRMTVSQAAHRSGLGEALVQRIRNRWPPHKWFIPRIAREMRHLGHS